MDDQLDRLEIKVAEAVELIQALRRENLRLGERCQAQEARVRELETSRDRLQEQLAATQAAVSTAADLEARKQLIERKISSLLEKLEAIG